MNLDGYVTVPDRLRMALAKYPDLRVQEEGAHIESTPAGEVLVCVVKVWRSPDDPIPVIASASEPIPGRTPYTKNAERMVGFTSALGRALGYMGLGLDRGLASADEVRVRERERDHEAGYTQTPEPRRPDPVDYEPVWDDIPPPEDPEPVQRRVPVGDRASEAQLKAVYAIAKKKNLPHPGDNLSKREASDWIEQNGDPRG